MVKDLDIVEFMERINVIQKVAIWKTSGEAYKFQTHIGEANYTQKRRELARKVRKNA